jgi:hypothetical protein
MKYFPNLTPPERLDAILKWYEDGSMTQMEMFMQITELAADIHPDVIIPKLSKDFLPYLIENVHHRPHPPDEYITVSGAFYKVEPPPPKPWDDDLKWYAGHWRLHFYFADPAIYEKNKPEPRPNWSFDQYVGPKDSYVLAKWHIGVGDSVKRDQVIATIEGHVSIDFRVFEDGILTEQCFAPGDNIPADALIARVARIENSEDHPPATPE